MAEPHCFAPLQACRTRVAALESNGAPDEGADSGYVTDALIDASIGFEIEEGAEVIQKNGCGAICQTFKDDDKIKRATIALNLCTLDFELIWLMVGGDLFTKGGDTFGWKPPKLADPAPNGFCLEIWAKAWDGSQQASPASTNSEAAYFHFVFPLTKAQIGDFTVEGENFTVIPINGFSTENSNITINGPFDDWPAEIGAGGGADSCMNVWLDPESDLPEADCGFIAVTGAS